MFNINIIIMRVVEDLGLFPGTLGVSMNTRCTECKGTMHAHAHTLLFLLSRPLTLITLLSIS